MRVQLAAIALPRSLCPLRRWKRKRCNERVRSRCFAVTASFDSSVFGVMKHSDGAYFLPAHSLHDRFVVVRGRYSSSSKSDMLTHCMPAQIEMP